MKRIAARKPLQIEDLRQCALTYVGRYATSQGKLSAYLSRKIRERGWEGDLSTTQAIDSVVAHMVRLRFVDDHAYAEMKAEGLSRRGYGPRRIKQALGAAGIDEDSAEQALQNAAPDPQSAALAYAQRRRIGPFSAQPDDPKRREKAFAAMMRAGHDYSTARQILDMDPEFVHETTGYVEIR